jgi:hypothetical protein
MQLSTTNIFFLSQHIRSLDTTRMSTVSIDQFDDELPSLEGAKLRRFKTANTEKLSTLSYLV